MRIGVNTAHLPPDSGEDDFYLRRVLASLHEGYPDLEIVVITDSINDESYEGWERECIGHAGTRSRFSSAESVMRKAISHCGIERLLTPLATAPQKCPVPMIGFVVDLELLEQGGGVAQWCGEVREKTLRVATARSMRIIAPTEFARRRLLEWLTIPLDRVVVARPGVDHLSIEPHAPPAEPPFLLCVSQTHPHRKVDMLYDAFTRLENTIPHNLVLVGESGESERSDWGDRILRMHHCPSDQLAGLYQHADATICPAARDASGIAIISALYSGSRVVASVRSAVQEVARGVPFVFDPTGPAVLASAIRHALEEPEEQRAKRIRSGRQTAAEFSWATCATRIYNALTRSV